MAVKTMSAKKIRCKWRVKRTNAERRQLISTPPAYMSSLAHRLFAICLIAVALPACAPPEKTDLLSLPIPGVEHYPFRNESWAPLMETAAELADSFAAKGANGFGGAPTLAADATLTNEDIARSVDELLGPDWQRSAGVDSSRPHIHIMAWETAGYWHKRFYVIATWDKVYANKEGRKYRPIISVYSRP